MDTSKIELYAKIGYKDKDWYQKCQLLFEELFGKEKLELVTQIFAATSINSSLKSNVRLFRKALHEIENSLPLSAYLPVMKLQLERINKGEKIQGRKISAFASAMSGDPNAVVVDTWLLRAYDLDRTYARALANGTTKVRSAGATDKSYSFIENDIRYKALHLDLEPRQLCAMIWSGVRIATSNDRETHYANVLRHQLYNMFDAPDPKVYSAKGKSEAEFLLDQRDWENNLKQ